MMGGVLMRSPGRRVRLARAHADRQTDRQTGALGRGRRETRAQTHAHAHTCSQLGQLVAGSHSHTHTHWARARRWTRCSGRSQLRTPGATRQHNDIFRRCHTATDFCSCSRTGRDCAPSCRLLVVLGAELLLTLRPARATSDDETS